MEYMPVLLSLVAVLIAVYYYCFRGLNFFEKHGIIYPKPVPIFGNLLPFIFREKSMAEVIQDVYNIHPEAKYVGGFELMTPVLLIRDPEIIKSIAVKNFENFTDHRVFIDLQHEPLFGKNLAGLRGEQWKSMRNLLTPAFTSSKMKSMFKLMANCSTEFANFLSKLPEDQSEIELRDVCTKYTNDVIATCAFGIKVNSMENPENEFYVHGRESTNFRGFIKTMKLFFMKSFPSVTKVLGLKFVKKEISDFFYDVVSSTVKTRQEKGIVRPDMIQLMMESKSKAESNMDLTIQDMAAQAFIFFFGGFDTVSTLMCFVSHQLAVNPDIQKKLQDEIDKTLDETNGELTYEAVSKMEYLDAVLNETLRKYPVQLFLDRVCKTPLELPPALPGAKPFTIPAGMIIFLPVYGIQNDPKYFKDPDTFDPERFLGDGKKILNSTTYFPFGIGPRMCIGNRFALLETKVMICSLLARCDLKKGPRTSDPLQLERSGLTMSAEGGFWVKVRPRSNPHSCKG